MSAKRINRAVELLSQDQPVYYTGGHTGAILTHEQGMKDAHTWADYINVGMEHGPFDLGMGCEHYMEGHGRGRSDQQRASHTDRHRRGPC